jgi:hypothetical protein
MVVTSVMSWPLTMPPHWRLTLGGVHMAASDAWLWQLAWQLADALHIGGVICPSHFGAVTITLQPPRQVAIPLHMTPPIALILQLPLHVPVHVPSQ